MKDNIFLSDSNNFIKKHIIVALLCGVKAHFAVSVCFILTTTGTTWYNFFVYVVIVVLVVVCFLFIRRGEAQGWCHCRIVRIRIACSSCRRPPCGKVTIYLRNGKGNGEFFLREVGEVNVKWMVYKEVALLQ